MGRLAANSASASAKAFSRAGSIAEEALALIRIVTAYNGQERELSRYQLAELFIYGHIPKIHYKRVVCFFVANYYRFTQGVLEPYRMGVQRSFVFGLGMGFSNGSLLAMSILCLWYVGTIFIIT